MAMAAAACIGRGRKAEERRTPHASPNSNAEGERPRSSNKNWGEKKRIWKDGWVEERRERESWEESPKNNAASASLLPAPTPKDLLRRIIWQSVGSATLSVVRPQLSLLASRCEKRNNQAWGNLRCKKKGRQKREPESPSEARILKLD